MPFVDLPTLARSVFSSVELGVWPQDRRGDLAKLGMRAMLGGTLAAFMTACIAGILI